MRVSVVSPNRERIPDPLLPIGAATVAALFRELGHDVRILDLCHELDPLPAVRRHVAAWEPELVGLSIRNLENNQLLGHRSYLRDLRELVRTVRDVSAAPIVGGGAGYTLFPGEVLEALDLEYGLAGEAEESLGRLVDCIEAGRPPAGIPGVCYWTGDRVVTQGVARVRSFGRSRLPAYDLLDCPTYVSQGAAIAVESKRGCDLGCSFCPDGAESAGTRLKPASVVVDEIESLTALVGTNRLHFTDGVFHHPVHHAEDLCREIIRRGLVVRWRCGVNPVGLSLPLLELMYEAGCRGVALGLDAVTARMLRSYRKGFGPLDIVGALAAVRSARIPYTIHVLFGGPGETDNSVRQALDVLDELAPNDTIFFALGLRVFTGTALARSASRDGRIPEGHNMLGPTYYLSPALDERLPEILKERCAAHPLWFSPPY
jgi:radical SAM superfamily enzyme YgiQ (UPF0313 family)